MNSDDSKIKYYLKETAYFIFHLPETLILSIFGAIIGFISPIVDWIDNFAYKMKNRKKIIENKNKKSQKDYLPWLHK